MLNFSANAQSLKQQGVVLYRTGQVAQAVVKFKQAAALQPGDAGVWDLLGIALIRQGLPHEAVEAFQKAAALQEDAPILSNLGAALMEVGRYAEALEPLRRAVTLSPDDIGARHNLAKVLLKHGRTFEALRYLEQMCRERPREAELHHTRGIALAGTGQSAGAVAALREALALQPTAQAQSQLLMALHEMNAPPREILEAARSTNAILGTGREGRGNPASASAPAQERPPQRVLRIGYLSADFSTHPVATFFEPLLRHHDKTKVEAWCYASVRRPDEVTRRLRQTAAQWRDISRIADGDAAALMRQDGIDILVDLGGHTPGNRLGVAAHKPAPVAVTYLGYPATTGLEAVDYRLTDALVDPPGAEAWYTEKLVRLAGPFATYQPPDAAPAVGPLPLRARGHCTFGCFASRGKISPALLEAWAEILSRVSGSHLRVYVLDPAEAAESIRGTLQARGVAAERVELFPRLPLPEYMAAHHGVDIMLDTFPLSGHTTVCHALWMGVPAVCLEGPTCWQRLGASVLAQVGLGELAARGPGEYVERAAALALDRGKLGELRECLRERMEASPVMDHQAHARRVEEAYGKMWAARA